MFEAMMKKRNIWVDALADLLLPRGCLVCGRKLGLHEEHICLYCLADMPMTYFWQQGHNSMADKINGLIQKTLCSEMDERPPDAPKLVSKVPYAYATALFYFQSESDYRHILYCLKYKGDTAVGEHFGKILGRRMAKARHFEDVDAVIPVPLHWSRKWSRGYNQAECIAKTLATELGAELRTDILSRRRRTTTQTRLDIDQKRMNVQGAFEATQHGAIPRHILLVDDLFTTGSTLYACYTALRSVFPQSVRISFATLGYVGRV
jgi:ComF family protein